MWSSETSGSTPAEYLPLTFSQKWLITELQKFRHPGWISIEFLLRTKVPMHEWAMKETIYYLADKYENLRVKFVHRGRQWVQEVYPLSEADPFAVYDLSSGDVQWRMGKLKELCSQERDSLLPEKGNLMRVLYFKFRESEGRIWFCLHHMIADYVSAVMLATEFMSTYNYISQEKELKWQTGKDYRKWLYMVEGYCRDVLLPAEMEYWETRPWDKIRILPSDFPDKFHTDDIIVNAVRNNKIISSYTEMTHSIDADETSKLFGIFGVEFENILTAVFFLAVAKSKQMEWLNINVCNSGRNILPPDYRVDANKLVGYISTARALLLKRPEGDDLLSDVYDVVDQIKSIPNAGIGFYLIRDHIKNSHLRSSYFYFTQQGDIFLNYFGRMDANNSNEQYDVVMEDTGLSDYTMELQNTLLECLVGLRENRLHIKIAYSDVYFRKETIGEIIDGMKAIFQGIVSGQTIENVA